jgi:hypothetical protein
MQDKGIPKDHLRAQADCPQELGELENDGHYRAVLLDGEGVLAEDVHGRARQDCRGACVCVRFCGLCGVTMSRMAIFKLKAARHPRMLHAESLLTLLVAMDNT